MNLTYTGNLSPSDVELLARSGISERHALANFVRRVSHQDVCDLFGYPNTGKRDYRGLAFEFHSPFEVTNYHRIRLDTPKKDGQKYMQPTGSRNRLFYTWGTTKEQTQDTSLKIVFAEGEKKQLALSELLGASAMVVACTGVWNWKCSLDPDVDAEGNPVRRSAPLPDFDFIAWTGRKVQVCFDADVATNTNVARARAALVKELQARGALVQCVDVPAGFTGLNGVDDWIAVKPDAVRKWFDRAESNEVKREPLTVVSAADTVALDLPPLAWAVNDLWPAVGVALLAGRPKEGKSWLALQLALAVAAGAKAMGRFETEQSRVLYMALEDNPRRMQDRLKLLDVEEAHAGLDIMYDFRIDGPNLEDLKALIVEKNHKLICIDTFMSASGSMATARGANIVQDDYERINVLKRVAIKLDVLFVLVCHTRKRTRGEDVGSLDSLLGTTGVTACADLIMILEADRPEKKKDEDEGDSFKTRTSSLTIKGKDSTIVDALKMTLDLDRGGWCLESAPAGTTPQRVDVLQAVGISGGTLAEIAERLGKPGRSQRKTVDNLLRKLRNAKALEKVGALYRVPTQASLRLM